MQWAVKLPGFYPVWSLAFLLLSSCMVGPDYVRPATETATQWLEAEDRRLNTTSANDQTWWKSFNDPVLNQLIDRAYLENLNIRIAGVRVLEARAQLGIATGNIYPQNQQLTGSLSKVHLSERASQAAFSKIFANSQAPAWEFSSGSASFPSREATTCMDAGGRATQERLPRASPPGFPSWSLGTRPDPRKHCVADSDGDDLWLRLRRQEYLRASASTTSHG